MNAQAYVNGSVGTAAAAKKKNALYKYTNRRGRDEVWKPDAIATVAKRGQGREPLDTNNNRLYRLRWWRDAFESEQTITPEHQPCRANIGMNALKGVKSPEAEIIKQNQPQAQNN